MTHTRHVATATFRVLISAVLIAAVIPIVAVPALAQGGTGGAGGTFTVTATGGSLVAFAWSSGTAQAGYQLLRLDSTGVTRAQSLPASATSALDPLQAAVGCYQLTALDAAGHVLHWSRGFCVLPQVGFGVEATNISIRGVTEESPVATLTWTPAPGATGQALVAFVPNMPAGSQRVQLLAGDVHVAADDTGGQPTCYVVLSATGGSIGGASQGLCALPPVVHLPPPSPRVVTRDDNGKTIDLQLGDQLLLALGGGFVWTVSVADPSILQPVEGAVLPDGAQGLYQAVGIGQTKLSARGDPPCYPLCLLPSLFFQITVDVLPPPP